MMGRVRSPKESSPYYIPKSYHLAAVRYARQYKDWKGELEACRDTSKAIAYDKEKVQTSGDYDSTYEAAVRCAQLSQKIDLVDEILAKVAPGLESYIRLSVCYGFTYYTLMQRGMPINRNEYGILRQKFYFELSKKI
jgi:hypothetical protein